MKEKFIHFIKVITYQEYRELKAEWEQLNKGYDLLHSRKDKLQSLLNNVRDERDELDELVVKYKNDLSIKDAKYEEVILKTRTELQDIITGLRNDIEKKDKKLKEKDEARKEANKELKAAKKTIGEQEEKIKQLEEQVEFLKSHRRAPDLEEIKDYQESRKRGRKKKSEVVAA